LQDIVNARVSVLRICLVFPLPSIRITHARNHHETIAGRMSRNATATGSHQPWGLFERLMWGQQDALPCTWLSHMGRNMIALHLHPCMPHGLLDQQ